MKHTLEGRRILVVEDNAINRRLCRLQLERLGCKVSFAEDGLEMIDRYSPGVFDALLVDMQMCLIWMAVRPRNEFEKWRRTAAQNGRRSST